jgi:hypothetical protein
MLFPIPFQYYHIGQAPRPRAVAKWKKDLGHAPTVADMLTPCAPVGQ